jgi:predicted Zn-dependent protease with MMP-like domain
MTSMDQESFDAVVDQALASLPAWVREALSQVDVIVVDEPDAAQDPGGEGLLGLYSGTPLTEREANYAGELPDVIYLFRNTHLALELQADALRAEVAKTLMHEIAHYFGYDDDYLEDRGWA